MKTYQQTLYQLLITTVFLLLASCGGGDDDDAPTPQPVTPSNPDNPSSAYTLTISPSSLNFGSDGGTQSVTVTTNATSWTAESSKAWCKISQSGTTLTVSAEPNHEASQRTATITVKATGVSQSQTITVTQANAEGKYCTTDMPNEWVFSYEASTGSFLMTTNIEEFTVTSTEPWCTAYVENGSSDDKKRLVISVTSYEKADGEGFYENELPRQATVRVAGGNVFDRSILIVQNSHIYMLVNDAYGFVDGCLELSPEGETKEVSIETNCYSWTPYTDAEWLTVRRKDGNTVVVTSRARSADDTNRREAVVKIVNDADEYNNVQFTVRDAQADIHGEDYGYDSPTGWD